MRQVMLFAATSLLLGAEILQAQERIAAPSPDPFPSGAAQPSQLAVPPAPPTPLNCAAPA